MPTVLDSCTPRPEILAGSFNPEVFTASLGPVLAYYRTGERRLDDLYLDAEAFFRDATYPTEGLRTTLKQVFSRLSGDMGVPAIHRLETGFGGGKTHTLIACTHIAFRGRELAHVVQDIIEPALLPEPGSIFVVGVAGDEIPVHRPQGTALVPYTLWGEIAHQIGGEALYREVEDEASSYAAPGASYFERVFGGRRVLLMLDELAQYAARLEAARPDGADQLAAFLMGLHNYARTHQGIAVILTLASATDAFSRQTERLKELLGQVRGQDVREDDALTIAERAHHEVMSVASRDAVQVTPVAPHEITSVFAKRLFVSVDKAAAETVADEYMQMYRRNSQMLPADAVQDHFRARMVATYPFHPTFVDFLNNKLAAAENFQKTRGVLRVLSLVIRHLWKTGHRAPMIHTCHLDLRSRDIVEEILGRTGSSDLLFILHADVGGAESGRLEGGRSNAEALDERNPHPEGYPLYELTWKTVFLNSLVGRQEGLASKVFGATEQDVIFQTAFPGLTPAQVRVALEAIQEHAFYLRFEQGKYFASEEPTINSVLARIRRSVTSTQVEGLLDDITRKAITGQGGLFRVVHGVQGPEHVPDDADKPVLGVVSLWADELDVSSVFTSVGDYKPRQFQNHVYLLVPDTVTTKSDTVPLLPDKQVQETKANLDALARSVLAMQTLAKQPENFGVNPRYLQAQEFTQRRKEREQALQSAVVMAYRRLFFPSREGYRMVELTRSAGGEKGAPLMQQIREVLIKEEKLVAGDAPTQAMILALRPFFFEQGTDLVMVSTLVHRAKSVRGWPLFESRTLLAQILRQGVEIGAWCVFIERNSTTEHHIELFHKERPVPMTVDVMQQGYGLVTVEGAKVRGWFPTQKVDVEKLVEEVLKRRMALSVADLVRDVMVEAAQQASDAAVVIKESNIEDVVSALIRLGRVLAYEGTPDQHERPTQLWDKNTAVYTPRPEHVVITVEEARARGWQNGIQPPPPPPPVFVIRGHDNLQKLWPLLRRIESVYLRGGKCVIELLDLAELEGPANSSVTLTFSNLTPEALRSMGSTFEHVTDMYRVGPDSDVELRIKVNESCAFYQEIKKLGL